MIYFWLRGIFQGRGVGGCVCFRVGGWGCTKSGPVIMKKIPESEIQVNLFVL